VDTEQLAHALTSAISAGDAAALDAMCAEDVTAEWIDSFRVAGRANVVAVCMVDHSRNADFRTELVRVLVVDAEQVCFRARVEGTQVRALKTRNATYPPLGKRFSVEYLCHVETRDGKIVALTYAYNQAKVLIDLGHLQPY
jgi:ketosteroid isomerase-like protein